MSKQFVDGMRVYKPSNKAPEYVVANIEITIDQFKNWIFKNQDSEKIRIDIKIGQSGKYYAELNTWKPTGNSVKVQNDEVEENQSDGNSSEDQNGNVINVDDIPW